MSEWMIALFPLINAGTQLVKLRAHRRVPKWALPMVNVGLGTALAYAAHTAGIPVDQAVGPDLLHCLGEGFAIGGAATVAHDVVRKARP